MVVDIADQVQRGLRNQSWSPHFFAIVDEVDSILIDEARTPLIISGRAADAAELYYQFARIVRGPAARPRLRGRRGEAHRRARPRRASPASRQALGVENLYENVNQNYVHQLQQALRAKELFKRDVDYIVQDGEVKIVDEFTGRILEGRRWSEGLHQAVEAKEGVKIKEENQTLATVTLQNYFRLYEKLAGMTGTASTEAGEFAHTYDLQVVSIPTNRPMVRLDNADLIYKTEDAKFDAAVDDIAERHEKGQPVLVGTISVEKSEKLSRELQKKGIPHEVLNAKQHEREAEIVTQAGQLDGGHRRHQHGRPRRRHPPRRQPRGPGPARVPEGRPRARARPSSRPATRSCSRASRRECKAEGEKVRELGGLYVLGTERHESRRIDNQLRGRAGRQGDPGESRFYLSLEDELMRLFATGLMSRVMDASFPDDVPLESKMVSQGHRARAGHGRGPQLRDPQERAQVRRGDERAAQGHLPAPPADPRRRRPAARTRSTRSSPRSAGSSTQYCLGEFFEDWDVAGLLDAAQLYYPTRITKEQIDEVIGREALERCSSRTPTSSTRRRREAIGAETLRDIERRVMLSVIDQHWREHLYEMDYLQEGINLRAMGQQDPLSEWQREGFDMFEAMMGQIEDDFVRYVFHLQVVVDEEPRPDITQRLRTARPRTRCRVRARSRPALAGARPPRRRCRSTTTTSADAAGRPSRSQQQPVRVEKTPGRNEPCFCGSGKKYKLCHGAELDIECVISPRSLADSRASCRRRARVPAHRRRARRGSPSSRSEASAPDLWDDADHARKVTSEMASVREDVELVDELDGRVVRRARRCTSSRARRTTTRSRPRSPRASARSRSELDKLELRALFSGEHDERDAICEVHSGAGGTDAQDWAADGAAHVSGAGPRRRASRSRSTRSAKARRPGITSATFIVKGRYAYGMLEGERGVHRLIRISPFDAQRAPPDRVRVARLRARARTGRAARDRPERPAHRHVPLVGRGRSARERHRLRGAHHAPPDGRRRVVPERALAAAEPGQGDADPRGAARGASARGAAQRAGAAVGRQAGRRVRQPDPHVHARAVPTREGRAHALRDRQRAGSARRRPRRVHRGVPALAPTTRDSG